jgi:hypothetical protein
MGERIPSACVSGAGHQLRRMSLPRPRVRFSDAVLRRKLPALVRCAAGGPSCGLDLRAQRSDDGALAMIGSRSTTAHPHHRDVLYSLLEVPDGRRRTAWIYTVYRLNRKYPVGGVGKPAGDSRGSSGQDRPSRIALQHKTANAQMRYKSIARALNSSVDSLGLVTISSSLRPIRPRSRAPQGELRYPKSPFMVER